MFDKLFWIYNLGIKFIILGLLLFSILTRSYFFSTYTHSNQSGGAFCVFTTFMELQLYSFSMKMKMLKWCFHFFLIQIQLLEYKFLNQTNFFVVNPIENWKWKQKTLFSLANQTASKNSKKDFYFFKTYVSTNVISVIKY